MIRASRFAATTAVAAIALTACSVSTPDKPQAAPSTPRPTNVQEAEPCQLVTQDLLDKDGLKQAGNDKSATSRSCSWTSDKLSMMVLIRWDRDSLIDFSQAFPTMVGTDVEIDKVKVIVGKSNERPACATVLFAAQGTIVEVVAGYTPPAKVTAACDQAKAATAIAIKKLREQQLLQLDQTPTPTQR
ncbi:DUF3558 domain-containing protein [Kribbella sp. NBC_01505]|uniref:DUF3558 family protein n=1 Tax=Kribbella sp. NBC_01505 TaxID=2903580 RepID=UPI0038697F5E